MLEIDCLGLQEIKGYCPWGLVVHHGLERRWPCRGQSQVQEVHGNHDRKSPEGEGPLPLTFVLINQANNLLHKIFPVP